MTLEEAIELLHNPPPTFGITQKIEYQDALKLGIEALKRIKEWRSHLGSAGCLPLPGETKD